MNSTFPPTGGRQDGSACGKFCLLSGVGCRLCVRVDGVLVRFGRMLMRLGRVLVGLVVIAGFVMLGGFVVMFGCCGVVLCCFLVRFDCHVDPLVGGYPAKMRAR